MRKSQFIAREIDPLLSNLSPDSTLKALRDTSTIANDGSSQDTLTKSIADVSPAEREIGIRAAVAAQKLKQWRQEVEQWTWPGRRDRARGTGFMLPKKATADADSITHHTHLGCLPLEVAYQYEDRIEDIRDGVEALELEDIKDHVFSSHVPSRSNTVTETSPSNSQSNYGRMRDFTALVTATVVQALPDMANLNMMLDTWEVRLAVLRQIPSMEGSFKSTRAGVQTATKVIQDPKTGPLVTLSEYETAKTILGDMVASLGGNIDKLLDTLEGQEDTLPQEWFDNLEDIENEYAAWVVEAEHVAIQNDLLARSSPRENTVELDRTSTIETVRPALQDDHSDKAVDHHTPEVTATDVVVPKVVTPMAELPGDDPNDIYPFLKTDPQTSASHKRGPSLNVRTGHQRDISEISMADSAFSGMSDLSQAEIVDARSTQVLTSPHVSVVENQFRSSRGDLLSFNPDPDSASNSPRRPPILQRASTASFEVIPKDQVRQLTLNRSQSYEKLDTITQSPPNTPSKALRKLTGMDSPNMKQESDSSDPFVSKAPNGSILRPSLSQHPSAMVTPLTIRSKGPGQGEGISPNVPRRSSKRVSISLPPGHVTPPSPINNVNPMDRVNTPAHDRHTVGAKAATSSRNETLEDKIKDILITIPTKIRLADEPGSGDRLNTNSQPSSRSSTPTPALMLSPAKSDRFHRTAAPGDVREFHLTRAGQARDVPPVKLFVRAVGENGERVMVRVGGGWADLGEYLREYSLHHGHRGLADGNLEVASFPGSQSVKDAATAATAVRAQQENNTRPEISPVQSGQTRSFSSGSFNFGGWSSLGIRKSRKGSRSKSNESDEAEAVSSPSHPPPPVPVIPPGYGAQNGYISPTASAPLQSEAMSSNTRSGSNQIHGRNSTQGSFLAANDIVTPANSSNRYTPLGAAGPKAQVRRVVSHSTVQSDNNGPWVQGMVSKARAVSGHTTTVHGPTITTTTTVVSRSAPAARRVPAPTRMDSVNQSGTVSPVTSTASTGSPVTPGSSSPSDSRSKSKMSFGDVSGIRRVFLRRKSSK